MKTKKAKLNHEWAFDVLKDLAEAAARHSKTGKAEASIVIDGVKTLTIRARRG